MSWEQLADIVREARDAVAADLASPAVACPDDGEPYRIAQNGTRYCPFCGDKPITN